MARIIIEALHRDGEPRRWTLSERITPEDLQSEHYAAHLLERLNWAVLDATGPGPAPATNAGRATEPTDGQRTGATVRSGARAPLAETAAT